MPFKSGHSFTDINRKLEKEFKRIDEQLIPRGLYAAISVGAAYAKTMTPIDSSNLVNSQYIDNAKKTAKGWAIVTGFTANYAAAVHEMPGTLKGKPRSGVKSFKTKSGSIGFASNEGNFWDPDAEPQFLLKGFTEHMSEINDTFYKAIRI
tara:strand:- start:4818 stop:5267 length:450 start_codon:yes stop_codon:yes gene_type:complete